MATIDDLTFTLLSDGSGYSVKAKGTWISGVLDIPSSYNGFPVKIIEDSAFNACSRLTSVTIPTSVTSIEDHAFYLCDKVASLVIPDGVRSIGRGAFGAWSALTSVMISASVTSIHELAFIYCKSLNSVTVEGGNSVYHSDGNCCIETETNTLIFGCNNSVIPSGVTRICSYAFSERVGLTSITIPDSMKIIEDHAFNNCEGLIYFKFEGDAIPESDYILFGTQNLECVYVNAGTNGWGETWCGKPVVKLGSYIGNAVKYGETPLIKINLGEIEIYSMFLGNDQLF